MTSKQRNKENKSQDGETVGLM